MLEFTSIKETACGELLAFAKLNLYLEIRGQRPDGYHEIRTVMVLADLCDMLTFSQQHLDEITIEVDGATEEIGTKDNLVYKAGQKIKEKFGMSNCGTKVRLQKRIPMGAGLGGGSSDAAVALKGFSQAWGVSLNPSQEHELAVALGSDVPFFVLGSAAFATGRGENLTKLPAKPFWVVIAQIEGLSISTAWAYAHALADNKKARERIAGITDALAEGDVERLGKFLKNDFLSGIEKYYPAVLELRTRMLAAGALGVMLTGSGSALYAVCKDEIHAKKIGERIASAGINTWIGKAGIDNG